MSDAGPSKKKKKNKNRNKKKAKNNNGNVEEGASAAMDSIQYSVNIQAGAEDSNVGVAADVGIATDVNVPSVLKGDDESVVVDFGSSAEDHGMKLSTTETVTETSETFNADDLPENVKHDLLHHGSKNVTVLINGEVRELPPGVALEDLTQHDIAELFPDLVDKEGGNIQVMEVTETIMTEEGEEGKGEVEYVTEEVLVTTHQHGDHVENVETVTKIVTPQHDEEGGDKKEEDVVTIDYHGQNPENVEDDEVDRKVTNIIVTEEVEEFDDKHEHHDEVVEVEQFVPHVDVVHEEERYMIGGGERKEHSQEEVRPEPHESHDDAAEPNVVVDVQISPWKVDSDVQEIVQHNKRVRMTKITKSRRVIITKTADGEEVETVVEEEDDDIPEVIGEIGEFGETENETVEIQRIVKKRRIIITRTADGEEIERVIDDDDDDEHRDDVTTEVHKVHETDRNVEHTTLVTTRKVIITKNEFGEDIETVVDDDCHEPNHGHSDEEVIQEAVETTVVESEVDFDALFGPAAGEEHHHEPEHHHKPEHHHDDYLQVDDGEEDHSDFEEMDEKPTVRVGDIVHEEHFQTWVEDKDDVNATENDKTDGETEKPCENEQKTITITVSTKSQPETKHELTEEQRKMLDEVKMPQVKSVLDDWVLVDFTPKEIRRFAEVMRYLPGWTEESVEIEKCCKMM